MGSHPRSIFWCLFTPLLTEGAEIWTGERETPKLEDDTATRKDWRKMKTHTVPSGNDLEPLWRLTKTPRRRGKRIRKDRRLRSSQSAPEVPPNGRLQDEGG